MPLLPKFRDAGGKTRNGRTKYVLHCSMGKKKTRRRGSITQMIEAGDDAFDTGGLVISSEELCASMRGIGVLVIIYPIQSISLNLSLALSY